jgi:hypothetical protein
MMLAGTLESELGTAIETRIRISPDASYRVSGKPALQLRQNLTTVLMLELLFLPTGQYIARKYTLPGAVGITGCCLSACSFSHG